MIRAAVAYCSAALLWGSLISMAVLASAALLLGFILLIKGAIVTKLFGVVLLSFGVRLGLVVYHILKGEKP